ncbi:EF-hand domain-containing protein [Maritalea mobilis]|uniref:EF-hand domain-containing protein n=1 Tax=Maritalea mobilis TaxID=483324 RepID=UPI001C96A2D9|nr:EF-hand domain-containing protein [Maritalea mobilis]MBY6202538.1 EF-hand domain-containing protein [Maritalea mobilis]
MSIWKAALLSALIPMAALPAVAQDQAPLPQATGPNADLMFDRFDIDGDGTITRAEIENAPQLRFEAADADGNGTLDRDELIARGTEMAQARVALGVDRMIAAADADEDGALSAEEFAAARPDGGFGRWPGMDRGDRGDRGDRQFGRFGGRDSMPDPARLFGMVDADGDGVVSEEEFQTAMEQFMQRRDGGRRGWGRRG